MIRISHPTFSIFAILLTTSITLAASPSDKVIAGKSVKAWLALAAEHTLPQPAPPSADRRSLHYDYDPFEYLDPISQAQVQIGDVAGAAKTISSMERLLDNQPANGGMVHELDVSWTLSAELAANRTDQAIKILNSLGVMKGNQFVGSLIEYAPHAARLGDLNRALEITANERFQTTRFLFDSRIAWIEHVMNRDADSDRVIQIAYHELNALPMMESVDLDTLVKLLAIRGRSNEAFDLINKFDHPPESGWHDLLQVAAEAGNSKSVHALAALVVLHIQKQPLHSSSQRLLLACVLARAGAIPEAKKLAALVSPSSHNQSEDIGTNQFAAELAVWTHDPNTDIALAHAGIVPGTPLPRPRLEDLEFYKRMAIAFAYNDNPTQALAMANQTVGPAQTLAMFDVMGCEARLGQSDLAVAQFKKIPSTFIFHAARALAREWAQSKDPSGLPAWIASLKSPFLKHFAEIGIAEGALHIHVTDPYDSPPSTILSY